MAMAIFKCPKCGQELQIKFKAGKSIKPICEKCNEETYRIFKNIELNDVVSDDMLHIGQTMLYT